ncbi:hypothetical protein JCM1840_003298 [Sporobolomyces johnsonii]
MDKKPPAPVAEGSKAKPRGGSAAMVEVAAKKETTEAKKLRHLQQKNMALEKSKADFEKAEADCNIAELTMLHQKEKISKECAKMGRYHEDLTYS